MITFIFKTTTTMKEYNNKSWWIDSNIIPEITINAENTTEALLKYADIVNNKYYISITKTALKTKNKMYIDTDSGSKQIGWVITGSTDFEKEDNHTWTKQYIDLWVKVLTVTDTTF